MKVEIDRPFFRCEEDQTIFFSRLSDLSGYIGVRGEGKHLWLTLDNVTVSEIADPLQEICNIWNTNYRVLNGLSDQLVI